MFADAGSTPAASTIIFIIKSISYKIYYLKNPQYSVVQKFTSTVKIKNSNTQVLSALTIILLDIMHFKCIISTMEIMHE